MPAVHPLRVRPDYTRACARLRAKLVSFGIAAPDEDRLYKAVLDAFDTACFAYAAALQHLPTVSWHTVEIGVGGAELLNHFDDISTAASKTEALAFALQQMDEARIFPDTVTVAGERIEFMRASRAILSIAPIAFESPDAMGRERVTTALKGALRYGNSNRITARLRQIPGLEDLVPNDRESADSKARGTVLYRTAANLASRVRTMLDDDLEVAVPQHQALELVAALFNAPSWQHLIGSENEPLCFLRPVAVEVRPTGEKPPQRAFYRTGAEAVWGFAQAMREHKSETGIAQFAGTDIEGVALFLTSDDSFGLDTRRLNITSWTPQEVDETPRYERLVKNLLIGSIDLQQDLARLLDIEAPAPRRRVTANLRMGVLPQQTLEIKGLTFTIRAVLGSDRPYLHVERFDEEGSQKLSNAATAIYKASVRSDGPDAWVLLGDYDRDVVARLDGFSVAEARQLAAFGGIQLNMRPWREHERLAS